MAVSLYWINSNMFVWKPFVLVVAVCCVVDAVPVVFKGKLKQYLCLGVAIPKIGVIIENPKLQLVST